ncbi:MAG: hypothetical protein V4492_04510, partial [Chlamydiota bacterium]
MSQIIGCSSGYAGADQFTASLRAFEKFAATRALVESYNTDDDDESGILNSGLSLLALFQMRMAGALGRVSAVDPTFFPSMVITHTVTAPEPLRELFSLFVKTIPKELPHFSKPSDYYTIIDYKRFERADYNGFHSRAVLYSFYRIVLLSLRENNLVYLHDFLSYVKADLAEANISHLFRSADLMMPVLRFNDPELLRKTPSDLGVCSQSLLPVHHYRMGIRQFIYLFHEMNAFHVFCSVERGTIPLQLRTTDGLRRFLTSQWPHIRREVQANIQLSPVLQRTLQSAVFRHFRRLIDTNCDLEIMKNRVFSVDPMLFYHRVICSSVAQEIAAMIVISQYEKNTRPIQEFVPIDAHSV